MGSDEEIPETSDEEDKHDKPTRAPTTTRGGLPAATIPTIFSAGAPAAAADASHGRGHLENGAAPVGAKRAAATEIGSDVRMKPVIAKRPRQAEEELGSGGAPCCGGGDVLGDVLGPLALPNTGAGRTRRAPQAGKNLRECRALTDSCGKATAKCTMSLHDSVLVTQEEGDPRQSDPEGFGVLARTDLAKGTCLYDPAVKYYQEKVLFIYIYTYMQKHTHSHQRHWRSILTSPVLVADICV